MGKKQFDPKAVGALLERGKDEVRVSTRKAAPEPKETGAKEKAAAQVPKKYLTLYLSHELYDRVYDYHNEYRKSVAREERLHPGISGAVERLLREHFKLQPL